MGKRDVSFVLTSVDCLHAVRLGDDVPAGRDLPLGGVVLGQLAA